MFSEAINLYLKKTGQTSFKPKAFLFDMDGVLFDSMPFHAKAWKLAFSHIGIEFDEYQVYLNEGRTGASTVNEVFQKKYGRIATDEEIQNIYDDKAKLFVSISKTNPMPCAKEVLQLLTQAGKKIILVTGSGQKSLLTKLNDTFPNVFSYENMITSFDVKYGKPNPEPYLMALQKAGVSQNEAVVIENAPLGVRAGVAANIFTVALNTGILTNDDLLVEGANVVFPSMRVFLDKLPELLKI